MAAEQHAATTEFNEALKAAFETETYDDLAGFYTEDSVLLPPRGRMLEGRGPVSSFWRGVKARFAGKVFTTTSLKSLGDTVLRETGTYAPAEAAGPPEGKYVFVWQRVDDEWQIESTIWNRSAASGQGQGQAPQGQGGGRQRRAGGQGGAPGGGQRRQGAGGGQGAGGQGAGGYRQGGGGYRQGGQGGGGYRQGGGYQGGARPSFQGGGGIGGGRRGGGGQRRGGGQGPGQGGGQAGAGSAYEQSGGLYSDLKE